MKRPIDKEVEEMSEKYQLLIRELAFKIMQTAHVISIAEFIPQEERNNIEEQLRCANELLFTSSLRDSNDILELHAIAVSMGAVKAHNESIQEISLKFAPKKPYKIEAFKCTHSFSGDGKKFMDDLSNVFERNESNIEKLRQFRKKEKLDHLKRYHDRTNAL